MNSPFGGNKDIHTYTVDRGLTEIYHIRARMTITTWL